METLSVGVLTDVVYPFTHGGAEKRIALLSRELSRRGHEVTVYAMNWWNGVRTHEQDGVRYVGVSRAPRKLYANGSRRSLVQPILYGLRALRATRAARHDLVDCNQFPIVHLPAAQLGATVRRHPMVVTWHEVWQAYWFTYAPFPAGLVGAALEDMAPRVCDLNIAVSHHTARRLRGMGLRPDKVAVVPNAIDLARIRAVAPRPRASDLVFVGRLMGHKRVDRIIAAVAVLRGTLPEVRCAIVGSGPEEARLRALARGLGLEENVEFTGPMDDEDELLAVMKASRLFVSASEREGFGIAALEAMACGLPVVTVDAPMSALAEELVLDGYNGIVVGEPTARALAARLGEVLQDEQRLRAMATKARVTADGYDRRAVSERLELAYRRVLDTRASVPEATAIPAGAA